MPSTREFLDGLDADQLKFCLQECQSRIDAKSAEPKLVVWQVVVRGAAIDGNYRQEDFSKAWDRLMQLKPEFLSLAERVLGPKGRGWVSRMANEAPHIDAQLYCESEYAKIDFAK